MKFSTVIRAIAPLAIGIVMGSISAIASAQPRTICYSILDFQDSPVQILPESFEQGCAVSYQSMTLNPSKSVYILEPELRSTVDGMRQLESHDQAQQLNQLVDEGSALRVRWYQPVTNGSIRQVESIPSNLAYVSGNDICMRFPQDLQVVCISSGALQPMEITELLRTNRAIYE